MRLLTETAKREAPLEPGQLAPLAEANLEKLLAMFQENPLAGLVMRPDLPLPRLREMAKRSSLGCSSPGRAPWSPYLGTAVVFGPC